jgi:hypothetical protein
VCSAFARASAEASLLPLLLLSLVPPPLPLLLLLLLQATTGGGSAPPSPGMPNRKKPQPWLGHRTLFL